MKGIREPRINSAPGKQHFAAILEHQRYDDVKRFFDDRSQWSSYPISHERLSSYGVFDDLIAELRSKPTEAPVLIDHALRILEEGDEKYILNAVYFLLCVLMVYDASVIQEEHAARIIKLQNRVKQFAFLPNLCSFWEGVIKHSFADQEQLIDQMVFGAAPIDGFDELQIRTLSESDYVPCPCSISSLNGWMMEYSKSSATIIEKGLLVMGRDRYWTFGLKENGNEIDTLLVVHAGANGLLQISKLLHQDLRVTDIRLRMIQYHFSPWEHVAF